MARGEAENNKLNRRLAESTDLKMPPDLKVTHLARGECDAEKWPLIHLMRLLKFYAAHRCLWDIGCKENRSRKLRQAAIVDIAAAMNTGVTKEQVVQKINILRATYRYEKKRIKQRIRRGLGARTKLKWFSLADAFLRHVPKKSQKVKNPFNSDSDLEDTVVVTMNSESLMPLDQDVSLESIKEDLNTTEVATEIESILRKDSQFYNAASDTKQTDDFKCFDRKRSVVRCQSNKFNAKSEDKQYSGKKKHWTYLDTLKFLQLLGHNCTLLENSLTSLLEVIANEMHYSYESIEKRWYIFQNIVEEEKQKMLENPQHKSKYKWWTEAENLLKKSNLNLISSKPGKVHMPTEFIILNEAETNEIGDSSDYDNWFLQNPIPSVGPVYNIDESIASLFHEKKEEKDLDHECLSNSLNSGKLVWQGLDDDLLEGKWSLKQSVKFLRLYGVHRCLWDLNDPDYRSRPLRNAAIEDIAASMGHGLTASHVAKKIKIFRITYMQQRKRLLEATKKGKKPDNILKWFPLADSFLRPHIGLRSIKADAKEIPQFDYQYVYANLNLIDPALLTDFRGKGTQNAIEIGTDSDIIDM